MLQYPSFIVILLLFQTCTTPPYPISIEQKIIAGVSDTAEFDWPISNHNALQQRQISDLFADGRILCTEDSLNRYQYFHWVDLNHDHLEDLIFSGPCQPYVETVIFLNIKGVLQFIHEAPGFVQNIIVEDNKSTVIIKNEACCCTDYNAAFLMEIPWHDTIINRQEVYWPYDTIPEICLHQPFQTNQEIRLRAQPVVDDILTEWDCNPETKKPGNMVVSIPANTQGLILAKKIEQQDSWYFVLVKPLTIKEIPNIWSLPKGTPNAAYLGWIPAAGIMPDP